MPVHDTTTLSTIQSQAQNYIDAGFAICVIERGGKKINKAQWTLQSAKPSDFTDDDNIGLLCGTLSNDLVCVDLDNDDALARADEFLRPTPMIDGRTSKAKSHRWYRVTNVPSHLLSRSPTADEFERRGLGRGPKTQNFRGPNGMIVEIKGTGSQCVVPPSIHKSGESRSWQGESLTPAVVDCAALYDDVERLAKSCGWTPKAEKPKTQKLQKPKRQDVAPSQDPSVSPSLPPFGTSEPQSRFPLLPLDKRKEHAWKYIDQMPLARSGQGGHDTTYHVAAVLKNDFAFPDAEALELLRRYNDKLRVVNDAWSEEELRHKIESVVVNPDTYGSKADSRPINNPQRLASSFPGRYVFHRGVFHEYVGSHYRQLRFDDFRASVVAHIESTFHSARLEKMPAVTTGLTSNVIDLLKADFRCTVDAELPFWLDADEAFIQPRNLLACQNGLLDIDAFELRGHNAKFFNLAALPYDFVADAPIPEKLLSFLHRSFPESDGPECIALLQEWFGYCLLRGNDLQRALILYGPGGNGKSVILAVLRALLGDDNVSSVPLELLGERFHATSTLGRLANLVPDCGELDRVAEGRMKSFVSGDKMYFEHKGVDGFEAVPTARLVLATNILPHFRDRSDGLWRRLLILPVTKTIPQNERVFGADKIDFWLSERASILRWSLDGLARLRSKNHAFTTPQRCIDALKAHALDCQPQRRFLETTCVVEPDSHVETNLLWSAYSSWAANGGHRYTTTREKFNAEVQTVFPVVKYDRHRDGKRRPTVWRGLRYVPDDV